MLNKFWLAPVMASFVFAAGCGGGGGGGGSASTDPVVVKPRNDVVGPLDALQGPVSSQILEPLSVAVANTPLAGVVECLDNAVVADVLDVVDALSSALAPGAGTSASRLDAAAPAVQAEVEDLVSDLEGYVSAIGGGVGCSGGVEARAANPGAGLGSYAPMGTTLLPVLHQVKAMLQSAPPGSLSLSQVSSLLQQVVQAFLGAWGQVPETAQGATFVGTATVVVALAVNDLQIATGNAASGDVEALRVRLADTVERLLDGLLVDVVPIHHIETVSGEPGLVSGPIQGAIYQLSQSFLSQLGTASNDAMAADLAAQTDAILDPMQQQVLPMIFGPVRAAIADGLSSGAAGPTGTTLDPTLVTVGAVVAGNGLQDPLHGLLSLVLGMNGSSCPVINTPLSGLCALL